MLRRVICFLLFVSLLVMTQAGFAASPSAKAATQAPVIRTKAAAIRPDAQAPSELTQIRWAARTDAVTGAQWLRVVYDVSGPVEADGTVTASPNPRLVVNIKGAIPSNISESTDLDGKIAASLSTSAVDGQNSKIVIELPLMLDDSDYKVFTLPSDPANNKPFRVVVDINKPVPLPNFSFTAGLKDKVITLDPGHGGTDAGAIGPNKVTEKEVNLGVALKVKAMLEKAGAKVLMTRQDDRDVYGPNSSAVDELKARSTVANAGKADIFVSIHSNASVSRSAGGTAAYYYQKTSYDSLLARNLQAGMTEADGLYDRGTFPANFYVIKHTVMPAALVEMAFISNPDEEKLLINPQFQQKMAQGIVNGLDRFFAQAARMGGER